MAAVQRQTVDPGCDLVTVLALFGNSPCLTRMLSKLVSLGQDVEPVDASFNLKLAEPRCVWS